MSFVLSAKKIENQNQDEGDFSRLQNMVTVWASLPVSTNHNLFYLNKRTLLWATGFSWFFINEEVVLHCEV